MTHNAPQNTLDSVAFAARVKGVLFDIDETLVDLVAAMSEAMIAASEHLLPHFGPEEWSRFAASYMADAHNYYDRYVAGEFTFAEQRGLRAQAVFEELGFTGFDAAVQAQWIADFEEAQPRSIRAFADVVPLLDALDAAGIPYGAVSNNVHDYQRAKLDTAGLARIGVLVGIDTVSVAKPDPAIFREGCRLLGTAPEQTLYVGDNFMVDGVGSVSAGLHGMWLNREGAPVPGPASIGVDPAVLALVHSVETLTQMGSLLGLFEPVSTL